jgi:hypothetical protein
MLARLQLCHGAGSSYDCAAMRWLRHPYVRPLPALALLLVGLGLRWLAGDGPETPGVQREGLRTLACWLTVTGAVSYWVTLLLARAGMLHFGGSLSMRTPSQGELAVAELLLRGASLLIAYAAPWLLLWG